MSESLCFVHSKVTINTINRFGKDGVIVQKGWTIIRIQALLGLFNQGKIELFALQVGPGNLNGDRLPQLIALMLASSLEAIVLLVKLIEVIVQFTDRNHALALVLVDFHVKSPFS